MKIAHAIFGRGLTSERRAHEKLASRWNRRLLTQSVYLLAITLAMLGWIWLLTSIGIELISS
jgi:hypothetical protein